MEQVHIERHVDLGLAADELWELIADPEQLTSWLGDAGTIALRPGGVGEVIDGDLRRHVVVESVDPQRGFTFSWWDADEPARTSRVVFEIEATPEGDSHLHITETLSPQASVADIDAARIAWEVRVLSLWACTVAAALVQ